MRMWIAFIVLLLALNPPLNAQCTDGDICVSLQCWDTNEQGCCPMNGEFEFAVINRTDREGLAVCFFQREDPSGSWVDLVERLDDNEVRGPILPVRLLEHSSTGGGFRGPSLEKPDGRLAAYFDFSGRMRLYCALLEIDNPSFFDPESDTTEIAREAFRERLSQGSFDEIKQSNAFRVSKVMDIRRCESRLTPESAPADHR